MNGHSNDQPVPDRPAPRPLDRLMPASSQSRRLAVSATVGLAVVVPCDLAVLLLSAARPRWWWIVDALATALLLVIAVLLLAQVLRR